MDFDAEVRRQLHTALQQLGIPLSKYASIEAALGRIAFAYEGRLIEAKNSPRASKFIGQMEGLCDAVRNASSTDVVCLPDLDRNVFEPLCGRYPASDTDLTPVTTDMLRFRPSGEGVVRFEC